MSGHVFVISISDSFHKYFVLFCSAKLVIMRLNGGYESRFDVILPSQPYWNHQFFVCMGGDLFSLSVPSETVKTAGLGWCLLGAGSLPRMTLLMAKFYM